jgi:hypothetical protein
LSTKTTRVPLGSHPNSDPDLTNYQHNDIVVLMLPEFIDVGGPWRVLPLGIHDATLEEVEERFATNQQRKKLFRGFIKACKSLKSAGCSVLYLDGSYTTEAPYPKDYDVCWNPLGVDETKLDPVFYDFSNGRQKQKAKYGGEFFLSSAKADGSHLFIQYFQTDKVTGQEKGIIRIYL